MIALGQTVEVTGAGRVGGDVLVGAGEVTLAGAVGRRVMGAADTLRLAAAVGEGVDVEASNLVVEPSARINGDLRYRSNNEAQLAAGVVTGQVIRQAAQIDPSDFSVDAGEAALDAIGGSLAWIFVLALLGLLLLTSARGWMERTVAQLRRRPGASLLIGGIVGIVTVPAIVVVGGIVLLLFGLLFGTGGAFTTIPLPLAGLGLYALALYISPVFVALLIGRLIVGRFTRLTGFWALVVGLIVLSLLGAIPYVGWVIGLVSTVLGLGAALLAGRGAEQPAL